MAAGGKSESGKKGGGGGALIPFVLLTVLGVGLGIGFKVYFLAPPVPAKEAAAPVENAAKPPTSPAAHETGETHQSASGRGPSNPHGSDAGHGSATSGVNHGKGEAVSAGHPFLIAPDPVVTTLAGGPPSWIRLEVALVFNQQPKADMKVLMADVTNDFVTYLRTVKAVDIEGAEGLEYLSDDLADIARTRTHGAADRLVIKGLVVE
ncbi:MAG: flagellar basal body-associated FliL family protein [Alphaproteobacteria bacterium]|nr:flagellar basal body-associated FliL family protein [Alphaproteobacteria bacterium]